MNKYLCRYLCIEIRMLFKHKLFRYPIISIIIMIIVVYNAYVFILYLLKIYNLFYSRVLLLTLQPIVKCILYSIK